ncbi:hypothetical protein AGR2A_Cc120101 [Agrobacterium genomosp. 2 str. CFBP 5494]|uniref:Uncharacterized protein n=1 Tax=Agrobacterium genomosp. 2 str. CFBP 5494 TaxID=1183436 RepID=A0A9W5F1F1_9HYPH|nr:hypothetical protein AGR2A_Cc120101 [Agrobacterium genomosp. 2 str. CFBP 5494]
MHHPAKRTVLTPRPQPLLVARMLITTAAPPRHTARRRAADETGFSANLADSGAFDLGLRFRELSGDNRGVGPDFEATPFFLQLEHFETGIVRQRLGYERAHEAEPPDTDIDVQGGIENARVVGDEIVLFDAREFVMHRTMSPHHSRHRSLHGDLRDLAHDQTHMTCR